MSALAALPALTGSWIYDDGMLPRNPLLDGWDDFFRAFVRDSHDYFRAFNPRAPIPDGGKTWRPLPMASMIFVNALVGPRPWAHHLVSFGFHAGTVALLCAQAPGGRRLQPVHALALGLFAVHPCLLEAYGYINGRSDAIAGLALAGLALALQRERAGLAALCLVVGVLGKETFLLASPFVVAASGRGRRSWALWLAVAVAFVGARALLLGAQGTLTPRHGPLELGLRGLRVLALGARGMMFPSVRVMRLLAWEFAQPWRPLDVFCLSAAVVLGVVAWRLRRRTGWYSLGVAATLLPCLLLGDTFWVGFDRYLYQPAVLVVLGVYVLPGAVPTAHGRSARAGILGFLVVTAFLGWLSAGAYHSPEGFYLTMTSERPQDPTGRIFAGFQALDNREGRRLWRTPQRFQVETAVAPQVHQMTRIHLQLGETDRAAWLLEAYAARAPLTPRLLMDLVEVRYRQGRTTDMLGAADRLLAPGAPRREESARVLHRAVTAWLGHPGLEPPQREALGAIQARSDGLRRRP
ncbi:MAG: hypothetical protein HY909_22560 [Deltaproteobacteria bacterium]|nr:hypothetical protein [Deltaproteobacteria bacterium]